jgi:hypothetical protein
VCVCVCGVSRDSKLSQMDSRGAINANLSDLKINGGSDEMFKNPYVSSLPSSHLYFSL